MTIFIPAGMTQKSASEKLLCEVDERTYNQIMNYMEFCKTRNFTFKLSTLNLKQADYAYLVAITETHWLLFRKADQGQARFLLVSTENLDLWADPACGNTYRFNPAEHGSKVTVTNQRSVFELRNNYLELVGNLLGGAGNTGTDSESDGSSATVAPKIGGLENTPEQVRPSVDLESLGL